MSQKGVHGIVGLKTMIEPVAGLVLVGEYAIVIGIVCPGPIARGAIVAGTVLNPGPETTTAFNFRFDSPVFVIWTVC